MSETKKLNLDLEPRSISSKNSSELESTKRSNDEKKYVVIIDDDESVINLVAWLFIENNEKIAAFTDGAQALEFLRKAVGRIKCVLLDLSLPILDGLTIAEQIRLNESTFGSIEPVPIAFYTSYRESAGGATERIAERCNVERIFHKPEDTDKLPEKVNEWLNERESRNAGQNAF